MSQGHTVAVTTLCTPIYHTPKIWARFCTDMPLKTSAKKQSKHVTGQCLTSRVPGEKSQP